MKRTMHFSILTALLRGKPVVAMISDLRTVGNPVRQSGTARKRIESSICTIKRGQRVDGFLLDDGTWFIMPAHDKNDPMPPGFRESDWRCCVGVPNESVSMKSNSLLDGNDPSDAIRERL